MDHIEQETADSGLASASHSTLENESPMESYQKKLRGGEPSMYSGPTSSLDPLLGTQLSRVPVIAVGSLVAILLGTIAWGYLAPKSAVWAWGQAASSDKKPEPGRAESIIANAPATVSINSAKPNLPKEDPQIPSAKQSGVGVASNNAEKVPAIDANATPTQPDYEQQTRMQMVMQKEQEATQRETARRAHLQEAKEAPSTVFSSAAMGGTPASSNDSGNGIQSVLNIAENSSLQGHLSNASASAYLPHTRMPVLSPYEVKAGTVIPSLMLSGINSDLPGQLIAQVAQNVYDSATGQYLLIPQGSKLVGTYDHGLIVGQRRVLIVWNRIIYPDSSSLDIESMPGQDQSGYAGFKDKVNNHVWPAFQQALLLSALTAGTQLSQPRAQKGDYSYSGQQVIAGSMGMQLNQLGMSSYQGRANLSPTITIRPGYRFNVMVNKDMVIPPWQSADNEYSVKSNAVKTAWGGL